MKVRPLAALALLLAPAFPTRARAQDAAYTVASPDGRNVVTLSVAGGALRWSVHRGDRPVLVPSRLGFAFRGAPPLGEGFAVLGVDRADRDTTFTMPLGEVARVRDRHRELRVRVGEVQGLRRELVLVARAFDDGVALRYELPAQPNLGAFEIVDELTEFSLAEDMKAWSIPADLSSPDRQEMLYSSGPVSKLRLVHTPLTLQGSRGLQAVIHEADLVDYAGMFLQGESQSRTLRASLDRWKDGAAVKGSTPFRTPWRTVQLADRPEDLAPSTLTLKLNPPSRIADTRWLAPMKYDGIWWGMHLNRWTWGTGPRHGATTEHAKRYIDFAAANGLQGTLVEGWNRGWDGDWIRNGDAFDFLRATPDYDLPAVAAYAREKGVQLVMHNETATFVENYERQLDSAFALYARLGIRSVKTGYVGDTTSPGGHGHQSQYMVRHHRRVIETAARHGIAVVMHEPIKDAGERRTWPNMLSREGARGMEWNAWSGDHGNPPEHETILFFTRMLAGPMDFTPGIFDLTQSGGDGKRRGPFDPRARSTLARQLALFVVLYSPVQMAADLVEHYEGKPAYQFIRDVAADWDTTVVLSGRIGDHVAVARKAKGRPEWFLGAITDEEARTLSVRLDFLPRGSRWVAERYADGPGADGVYAPAPIAISTQAVRGGDTLTLALVPAGGQAIRLRPAP